MVANVTKFGSCNQYSAVYCITQLTSRFSILGFSHVPQLHVYNHRTEELHARTHSVATQCTYKYLCVGVLKTTRTVIWAFNGCVCSIDTTDIKSHYLTKNVFFFGLSLSKMLTVAMGEKLHHQRQCVNTLSNIHVYNYTIIY